ncbi:MAG: helix-turn-helix transcriptional regulator [Lachnospiraceae bacterium]|nr:helix-turn-helix transcriptional regulator [Lachnospiraceae bacterium]
MEKAPRDGVIEFRYYDMPLINPVIVFHGPNWRRIYGLDAPRLHFHNILEIGICREGEGRMVYEDGEYFYRERTISVVPRQLPHNTMNEEGVYSTWDYLFIDEGAFLSRFGYEKAFVEDAIQKINSRYLLTDCEESPGIASILDSIVYEYEHNQSYQEETIPHLIVSLLLILARKNSDAQNIKQGSRPKGEWIRNCLRFMENHYAEDISIREIASCIHMGETRFRELFIKSMRMTPLDYLNSIRIRNACVMLQESDLSIEMIAFKCGFSTLSTFNRNFRRYMGASPSKWRKDFRKEPASGTGMSIETLKGWY